MLQVVEVELVLLLLEQQQHGRLWHRHAHALQPLGLADDRENALVKIHQQLPCRSDDRLISTPASLPHSQGLKHIPLDGGITGCGLRSRNIVEVPHMKAGQSTANPRGSYRLLVPWLQQDCIKAASNAEDREASQIQTVKELWLLAFSMMRKRRRKVEVCL